MSAFTLTRPPAIAALLATALFLIQAAPPGPAIPAAAAATADFVSDDPALNARLLYTRVPADRNAVLDWMRRRGNTDVVPALIDALRYLPQAAAAIVATLEALTGAAPGSEWEDWMLWQQANPGIEPFTGYDRYVAERFSRIDAAFEQFFPAGVAHAIRLEEIAWGGVVKDGIPALIKPRHISAAEADYLDEAEPVFGVAVGGEARAYPYRIMDWHEMVNDVVGGVPVSLAYCTLCGAGILYDTRVTGRATPFVFGSSGLLYRSNKLMYDQQTGTLWNQFTGRPVVGPLTTSGIELNVLPLVTTTWKAWRDAHPDTRVLALETGYRRDYTPGAPYGDYFASDALMFPALTADTRLKPKDEVFGLRVTGAARAWPVSAFAGGRVINDRIGAIPVVLIGDADSRTVRAYRSRGRGFDKAGSDPGTIVSEGQRWQVTEAVLLGPSGQKLSRLPGHLAYWFAWSGYHGRTQLYGVPDRTP
ncbi:MAG: DUF3179 domain-containing protein [Gammaproteobacteria bacterium]|nr:DUF3179 domain-containing protein [Gammaproteobacteria bacterium]